MKKEYLDKWKDIEFSTDTPCCPQCSSEDILQSFKDTSYAGYYCNECEGHFRITFEPCDVSYTKDDGMEIWQVGNDGEWHCVDENMQGETKVRQINVNKD